MEIELINAIPKLINEYKKVVEVAIHLNLITLEEWNTKYKHYRDDASYSMIHYLECGINKLGAFVTINPIMLENRKELQDKFKIAIMNLDEMIEFSKDVK